MKIQQIKLVLIAFKRNSKMEDQQNIEIQAQYTLTSRQFLAPPPPSNNSYQDQTDSGEEETVSILQLYRFAGTTEVLLIVIGSICAALVGTAWPLWMILWGNITDNYGDGSESEAAAKTTMLQFIYIGLGAMAAAWGMITCWMIAGQRQSITCRKQYLKSLLSQQIGWFDTINQSELATKFATDCFIFQAGIGQKVGKIIMVGSVFLSGIIAAFIYGWLMTLVIIVSIPALAFGSYLFMSASERKEQQHEKDYSFAGGQVEQAISSIKTVKQLNGEQFQAKKYSDTLINVTKTSIKHGIYLGLGIGAMYGLQFASYSLGLWYGSHCIQGTSTCPPHLHSNAVYTAGEVIIIFFCIVQGGYLLSMLSPSLKKVSEAKVAATRIFKIIDRKPLIRPLEEGIILNPLKGVFKFEAVTFAYPKDKSKIILKDLNIEIGSSFSAFAGESGCGKSTIFQLMMRFYDPDEGRITLDGVDLKDIDLTWLRNQIGYVGQEPVLFATTIRENLLFGKENATDSEIQEALKKVEALEFIDKLKDKLETFVGMGGSQLSGGQKQRIAIARALLKNPKILLLDEATSALDRRNEKLIQNTLNKIALDKMTITIAHRIKTIMKCNHIFVLEGGKVVEQGVFKELNRFKDVGVESQDEVQTQSQENDKEKDLNLIKTKQQTTPEEKEKKQLEDEERKKKEDEQLLQKYGNNTFIRLFAYASDKKGLFALGILLSIVNGVIYPIFSIFLSKILSIFIIFKSDPGQARTDSNLYSLIFLLLGIASFIINLCQFTIFTYIGEEMTEKVRNQTYLKILKMPVPWFDRPKNSSGFLSARLASDCRSINDLVTTFFPILTQTIITLIAGVVISLIYEWRTALVALGMMPLLIISGAIETSFQDGFSNKTDKVYKQSSQLISQSMNYIRTVTSFASQAIIQRKYEATLSDPLTEGIKKGLFSGFLYGMYQIILFATFGIVFYFGVVFMTHNNLQISDVFVAIYANYFSSMAAGNNFHFMPDVAAGKKAAASVFEIQDSLDEDQLQISGQSKMLATPIQGHIELKNLTFKYESRDHNVFTNLSLEIKKGQKVGFVGPSGCGKSTIHQLLQRFYDPDSGEILIDGINIKDYNLHHLRSCLGVVSQQPVLFNDTIGENIRYNKIDATHQEIVQAANESNFNPEGEVIEEIDSPKKKPNKKKEKEKTEDQKRKEEEQVRNSQKKDGTGFDKNVGVKGSHISGGQKQRVAIARVILRHPHVLLLDEATSALDSVNEKKVQQSLDNLMQNKTSITITHRIDTIKNCDNIMVFSKGSIVEEGSFESLMELRGHFYNLEKGLQFM